MQTIEQQKQMFDITVEAMDEIIKLQKPDQIQMMSLSMLSDIQEMIAGNAVSKETIRRALNRAKYFVHHII